MRVALKPRLALSWLMDARSACAICGRVLHLFSDDTARNLVLADPGISCRLRRSPTRDVHDSTVAKNNADVGSAVSSAPPPGEKLESQRPKVRVIAGSAVQ